MGELFDESHYFMCEGGLKPARLKKSQEVVVREDGNYYLTEYSLKCKGIDFACRWIALLFAIIAAAMVLLLSNPAGWVILAALGAAVVGAGVGAALGAKICGDRAAVLRVWITIKTDAQLGEYQAVANRPPPHLSCKAFGYKINYTPNVTSEFQALCIFGGNVIMTGLEGFMYAYATRGVGMLFTKPLQFLSNFGANYLKTLSVSGFVGRAAFGAWGGFNAYSMSSTKMTVSEGLQSQEVWKGAGSGFGFAEVAMYQAATEGDPKSIALLLSLGGIPGRIGGKDATWNDVKSEANSTAESWKNVAEKTKESVTKIVDAAKEFREKLKGQEKGEGAFEAEAPVKTPKQNIAADGYRIEAEKIEAGTRSIEEADFSTEGIKAIEAHVRRIEISNNGEPYANNKVMLERMKAINEGKLEPNAKDKAFYTHELREKQLMDEGLSYPDAHAQVAKEYGIDANAEKNDNPFYTDEAHRAWEKEMDELYMK